MAACPPPDRLEALLAGGLDDAEQTAVEAHVEHCAACQERLDRLTLGPIEDRPSSVRAREHPLTKTARSEQFFEGLKHVSRPAGDAGESVVQRAVVIDGYDILGELGRGAAGVVYRARHRALDRLVALKVILTGPQLSADARQRFRLEAQAIAKLKHPNIVQIYDVGESARTPYLSLELIEGENLAEWLDGKPRPAVEAAKVIASLAKAVEFAHRNGVVHRDLKPGNLILSVVPHRRGKRELKVTDFGIAKFLPKTGSAGNAMTQDGEILGTPAYMAPEQARGETAEISPATDVYSMGAILYEMLTGRPPFQGATSLETMMQALRQEPVAVRLLVPGVPRDLETICLKCLEKEPARRFASAAALAEDVGRFLRDEPIVARPVSWSGQTVRWVRRHRVLAAVLASAAVLAMTLTLGALVASGYFHALERQQHALAEENRRIADDNRRARDQAVAAEHAQAALRRQAEDAGRRLRENLYFNQMNLGSQAALSPSGIGRIEEWLAPWADRRPDLRNWEWYYLNGLCHRDRATLPTIGTLLSLSWQPAGHLLATDGSDGLIQIWDTDTREEVRRLYGHASEVRTVAWSPDGKRLLSAGADGTVRIWNPDTGQEVLTFRNHTAAVAAAAWSPDGLRVASCGSDGTVQIWNAATGGVQFVLRGHDKRVLDVAWSPDGRTLASSGVDTTIRLWDTTDGTRRKVLNGHTNFVNRLQWSHSGRLLASASNDQTAGIWDVAAGKQIRALKGHALSVTSVSFSPDDRQVAAASEDQTIKLFSVDDGRESVTLRGHTAQVTGVVWSPDGRRLASSGIDRCVKLWDTATGNEHPLLAGHDGPVNAIAWSPDDRRIASASADATVRIWDASLTSERSCLRGHAQALLAVAWSHDGTRIASAGCDHTIRIWDAADGRAVACLAVTTDRVSALAWSPDGGRLASAGDDKTIRLWDVATGRQAPPLVGHGDTVNAIAWSPAGERLASGSADRTAILWDVATGGVVRTLTGHNAGVSSVAWSPDGRSVATASADQTIKVWDAASGNTILTLLGHTTRVSSVAWSPDGSRLASGSDDWTVKLWDLPSGHETLSLDCRGSMVRAVAWSRDGLRLAAGLEDDTVLLYDAANGYIAERSPRGLPALDRELDARPADPDLWRLRAEIDLLRQDDTAAAEDAKHLLALDPGRPWVAIGNWTIGPYPADLVAGYPPESNTNPAAPCPAADTTGESLAWKLTPYHVHDFVDFGALYDHREYVSAYSLLKVYSPTPQLIALLIGSDDQNKIWLNGRLIHQRAEGGRNQADAEAVLGNFSAGWNRVLVRVINATGEHTLNLRLSTDPQDLRRAAGVPAGRPSG